MKMAWVMIQLLMGLKTKLDTLRRQGTSISGYIRSLVEKELKHAPTKQKGR